MKKNKPKCNAASCISNTSATATSNKKAMLRCFYTLKYRVTYVFIHCYCWIGYFAVFIPFILNICKLKYMFSLNIVHSEWANLIEIINKRLHALWCSLFCVWRDRSPALWSLNAPVYVYLHNCPPQRHCPHLHPLCQSLAGTARVTLLLFQRVCSCRHHGYGRCEAEVLSW